MTVSLSPLARMQFNQGGIPLAGGLLFTYAAGSTSKLATYTDSTGGTPNTNPIVLDSNGQCDIWLTDTVAYKFVLSPANDTDPPTNPYWTKDRISNVPSPNPIFTTVNKVTITQPTTDATLTLANGSTLATSGAHSLTFSTTSDSALVVPGDGTIVTTTATSFTNGQIPIGNGAGFTAARLTAGANISITNGAGSISIAAILNPPNFVRSPRTSNTILTAADNGTLIDITSGTFSQTFTDAATLGSGWYAWIRNSGTGDITLDPNVSEMIDGLTSYPMYPQETRFVQCDGIGFNTVVIHPFFKTFTASGTFTRPPGYAYFGGRAWSGGASGQRTNNTATLSVGGPGGGAWDFLISSATMGASQSVTVGAGGIAVTTVAASNPGGDTSIGSIFTVKGGSSGVGGAISTLFNSSELSGGGSDGFGTATTDVTGRVSAFGGGGTSNNASNLSGSSVVGGGGGGGVDASGNLRAAGTSVEGGNGGSANISANGVDGTAPAGGGGATQTGAQSGAGARGEVRIWGIA